MLLHIRAFSVLTAENPTARYTADVRLCVYRGRQTLILSVLHPAQKIHFRVVPLEFAVH